VYLVRIQIYSLSYLFLSFFGHNDNTRFLSSGLFCKKTTLVLLFFSFSFLVLFVWRMPLVLSGKREKVAFNTIDDSHVEWHKQTNLTNAMKYLTFYRLDFLSLLIFNFLSLNSSVMIYICHLSYKLTYRITHKIKEEEKRN
jgi:hypothetical protein